MPSIIYDTKYAIGKVVIDDSSCLYLCVLGGAATDEQTNIDFYMPSNIYNSKYIIAKIACDDSNCPYLSILGIATTATWTKFNF